MRSHCGSDVEVMRSELTHFTALRGIDYCRFSMRKNIQYVSLVPFYFYVFLSLFTNKNNLKGWRRGRVREYIYPFLPKREPVTLCHGSLIHKSGKKTCLMIAVISPPI